MKLTIWAQCGIDDKDGNFIPEFRAKEIIQVFQDCINIYTKCVYTYTSEKNQLWKTRRICLVRNFNQWNRISYLFVSISENSY